MAAGSTILSFIISVTTSGISGVNSLRGALGGLQGAYMGLAGVVSGVVVTALRNAAKEFDQSEKQAQIFYLTLGRFNQSIAQADKTVDSLSKTFNVQKSVVQDSVTQLLRAGYSMEQIEINLKGAGASALAFGKSAEMGFNNFTEAAVTGLSAQLNTIGVSQNLSQAFDQMAKKLGKNVDALTDQEKALATTQMMQKATGMEVEVLSTLTGGYTAVSNQATLANQNLAKAIGEKVLPYVIKATQWFAEVANMTAEWIRQNQWLAPTLEALANILMGLTNILMSGVRIALNVVINYFATLGQVVGRVIGAFQNAASNLGAAWEQIKQGNFKGAKEAGQAAETAFKNSFTGMGNDLKNVWKDTLKPTKQAVEGFDQIVKGGKLISDVYTGKIKPATRDLAAEKQNLWNKGHALAQNNKVQAETGEQNAEALKAQKKAAQEWQSALDSEKLNKYKKSLEGMTQAELEHELQVAKNTKNADHYSAVLAELEKRQELVAQKTKEWASFQERLKFDAYVEGLKEYSDAQLELALSNARAARDAEKFTAVLNEQKRRAEETAQKVKDFNENLKRIEFDKYVEGLRNYTEAQLKAAAANATAAKDVEKYNSVLAEQKRRLDELNSVRNDIAQMRKESALRDLIGQMDEQEVEGTLKTIEEALDKVKTEAEKSWLLLKQSLLLDRQQELEQTARDVGEAMGKALAGGLADGARGIVPSLGIKLGADQALANLDLSGGLGSRTLEEWQKYITPDMFLDEQEFALWQDALTAFFENVDVDVNQAADSVDMGMRNVNTSMEPVRLTFEELADRILPDLIAGLEGAAQGLEDMVEAGTATREDADLLLALADPAKVISRLDSQEGRGNESTSPVNPMDLLQLPEGMSPEEMVRVLLSQGFDYIQSVKEQLEQQAPDALQSEFGKAVMEAFKRALGGDDGKGLSYNAPFAAGSVGPTFADKGAFKALVGTTFEELAAEYTQGLIEDREATIQILKNLVSEGKAVQEDVDYLLALTGNTENASPLDSQEGRGNFKTGLNNPMDLLKLPEGLTPEDLVQDMLAKGFDYIQQFKERLESIAPDALQSEFGKVVMEAFKRSLAGDTSASPYDGPFVAGTILPTGRNREGLDLLTEEALDRGNLDEAYEALNKLSEEIQLFQGYMTPEIAASYTQELSTLLGVVQALGGDGSPWEGLNETLKENVEAYEQDKSATDALSAAKERLNKALGKEGRFDDEIANLTALKGQYPELTADIDQLIQAYKNLEASQKAAEQLDIDYGMGSISREEYLNRLKEALAAEVESNGNSQRALALKKQIDGIEKDITEEKERQEKLDREAIENAQKQAEARLKALASDINEWGQALQGVFDIINGGLESFGQAFSKLSGLGSLIGDLFGPGVGAVVGAVMNVVGGAWDFITGDGARRQAQEAEKAYNQRKENSGLLNLDDFTTKGSQKVGLFGLGGSVTTFSIDEEAVKFAQPIANAFEQGWDQGLMQALENGDFSLLEKSIKTAVGKGVIAGMAEQFKQEVLMEILRPALKAWAEARKTASKDDDAAALEQLKKAMGDATEATKAFYNEVMPIAEEAGLTGDGAGSSGGSRELFGAAPETVFAPVSTPLLEALNRIASLLSGLNFPNLDAMIASIDRFDAATIRFDSSTVLFDSVIRRLESKLSGSSTATTTAYARG